MLRKEQIQEYLEENHAHSMYTASIHFDTDITELYMIMEDRAIPEVKIELVGCSNPKAEVSICKNCIRNQPSDIHESFDINKKLMATNYTCDGYINKNSAPLF